MPSKHKAMSYDRLCQQAEALRGEIDGLCTTTGTPDDAEDATDGADARGNELPEELRHKQARLSHIQQAKARLEVEQAAVDDARGRSPDDQRRSRPAVSTINAAWHMDSWPARCINGCRRRMKTRSSRTTQGPEKSPDNPFIESFNGRFWNAYRSRHWLIRLDEARAKTERWRIEYIEIQRIAP